MKTAITRFRIIAITEGVSFLLLLGIAMPLKYFANMPMAVKVTGWIHGLLFILYVLSLLQVGIAHRWSFEKMAALFIASVLPAGTFVADAYMFRKVKTNMNQLDILQ
jgi:integral membrane protein